jgi:hypothetical protein
MKAEGVEFVCEGAMLIVSDKREEVLAILDLKEPGPGMLRRPAQELAHLLELVDFVVSLIRRICLKILTYRKDRIAKIDEFSKNAASSPRISWFGISSWVPQQDLWASIPKSYNLWGVELERITDFSGKSEIS